VTEPPAGIEAICQPIVCWAGVHAWTSAVVETPAAGTTPAIASAGVSSTTTSCAAAVPVLAITTVYV